MDWEEVNIIFIIRYYYDVFIDRAPDQTGSSMLKLFYVINVIIKSNRTFDN